MLNLFSDTFGRPGDAVTLTCIIVGASHAAAQLAASLRQEGWEGRILVIGEEVSLPYHRPPLSKEYLLGERTSDDILIRHAEIYARNHIEFLLGRTVTAIDRSEKTVTLDGGERMAYGKLALCTGARVRKVSLPGADLAGIFYLRTLHDVECIREAVGASRRAVIVGGGYIGLETAAALRKLGMLVTVLEAASRVLARVTAPELSEFYQRVHAEEGVLIETGVSVSSFEGADRIAAVVCADGRRFAADLVVVGVGVIPNVELADDAGLATDNGIVVDAFAATADPDIVAMGDCCRYPHPMYGYVRLESVPNATEQARSAAATLCGKSRVYSALPWFWSEQYDLKLQIAGLSQGYDQVVVRGDRHDGRSFAVFYLRSGQLIAADCINRSQEFILSKRIISERIPVEAALLGDEGRPFKSLLPVQDSRALTP